MTDTSLDAWRPGASLAALRERARCYARLREFFAARGVLEVDTPVLSRAAVSDPLLTPLSTRFTGPGQDQGLPLYLQTSPEYAMKRLLAAGSGPIYQLATAFRDGELGRHHNPEFRMLEWYRPGFALTELMDEVEALVMCLLELPGGFARIAYGRLFEEGLQLNPHSASLADLRACVRARVGPVAEDLDRDACLQLLFSHCLEPGLQAPIFVQDFPASQAALAECTQNARGEPVARRFELYIGGLELANGYQELRDAREQRRRFAGDAARCRDLGQPERPRDERLLAALEAGLPACSGVALGVDRLLLLRLGADNLDQVLGFSLERA